MKFISKFKNFLFGKTKVSMALVDQLPPVPKFDTPAPFTQGYQSTSQVTSSNDSREPITAGYVSASSNSHQYASYPAVYQPMRGRIANDEFQDLTASSEGHYHNLSLIPSEDHYKKMVPDSQRDHYRTMSRNTSDEPIYQQLTLSEPDELPPYGSTAQINMAQERWGKFQEGAQYQGSKIVAQSQYQRLVREGDNFVVSSEVEPHYFQLSLLSPEHTVKKSMSVDSQYHAPEPEVVPEFEMPEFPDAPVGDLIDQFPDVPSDEMQIISEPSLDTPVYEQSSMSDNEAEQLKSLQEIMDRTVQQTKKGELNPEETINVIQQFKQIEATLIGEQAKQMFTEMIDEYIKNLGNAAVERGEKLNSDKKKLDSKQYQTVRPLPTPPKNPEHTKAHDVSSQQPQTRRRSVQDLKKRFEETSKPQHTIKNKQ